MALLYLTASVPSAAIITINMNIAIIVPQSFMSALSNEFRNKSR